MVIGIDLALRNTGIVILNDKGGFVECHVISSDPKKYNNEALLIHNYHSLVKIFDIMALRQMNTKEKIGVGLEGLSFNSPSASVDLIAANHWGLRQYLYPNERAFDTSIIPPKSWQKSIINKDVLKEFTEKFPTIRAKKGKKLTKEETQNNTKMKALRRKETKRIIFEAVPDKIRSEFEKYVSDNKLGKDIVYDLADAYHIARYIMVK